MQFAAWEKQATARELIEHNFCGSDLVYIDMRRLENMKQLRARMRVYYRGIRRERGRMTTIGRFSILLCNTKQQFALCCLVVLCLLLCFAWLGFAMAG